MAPLFDEFNTVVRASVVPPLPTVPIPTSQLVPVWSAITYGAVLFAPIPADQETN